MISLLIRIAVVIVFGLLTFLFFKKTSGKYDLFKIIAASILFVALLTWVLPVSQFTGSEMYVGDIARLGVANLFATGVYSLSTVMYQVTFLFVLGGFYGVLSSTKAYKKLVDNIVNLLKGYELPFVIIISFIFAGLASICSEIYQLLIFVPFVITIISNLKLDKITALSTTFGSILIGRLGATYSPAAYNYINSYFGMDFNSEIITKVAIFVLAFVLFNFFNFLHTKETLSKKKRDIITEDKFATVVEETKKSKKENNTAYWPLIVILGVVLVLQVLGYVAWNTSFKISIFETFHNWLLEFKVFDHAIFSYILGASEVGIVKSFGNWDLFTIQIILIIATAITAIAYRVKLDELVGNFINGAKKMSRLVLILILIYTVFVITYWSPIVPTIVDWLMGLTKNFNIYLASLSSFIASTLNVDMDFAIYSIGAYLVSIAGKFTSLTGIIMNAMHGFANLFVPTSGILMLGLAYLNVPYKDWMKYIWKFLAGMLVGLLIIFTIVRYL